MNAELLVSVSGVRDVTRDAAIGFAAEMDQRGVRLSLLVAPRLKGKYRLADDPTTQIWLRSRRGRGDAIVLHGYDQAATERRRAEFATLPRHEALLRLTAADRAMEQAGLRTRLFAAPRWDASSGAMAALPELGFRLSLGLTGIHDLERNSVQKARVYGIGEGFRAEPWWCRALVLGAARTARRGECCDWRSPRRSSAGPVHGRPRWTPSIWRSITGRAARYIAGNRRPRSARPETPPPRFGDNGAAVPHRRAGSAVGRAHRSASFSGRRMVNSVSALRISSSRLKYTPHACSAMIP